MAFSRVGQVHTFGCFIAATAMLIGKTYDETGRLMFPDYCPVMGGRLKSNFIADSAKEVLEKLGCRVTKSRIKDLKRLQKQRRHALVILRWGKGVMCHSVVFDGETGTFMDPLETEVTEFEMKEYEENLECILFVEPPQTTTYEELAA